MLDEMAETYGARLIRGETPITKLQAFVFARMLGFVRTGEAARPIGNVILSELHIGNLPSAKAVA